MALGIQRIPDGEDFWGRFKVQYKDLILDSSYPAGGYTINAQDVGIKALYEAVVVGGNAVSGGLHYILDAGTALGTATVVGVPPTSLKLRVFFPTGGGGTAPSTLIDPTITAGGTGQAPIVPGIAKEVATGCNLSTVTVRVRFVGR